MINERTKQDIKNINELSGNEIYVYILLNSVGKVKVGITHNISQRIQSLSGSNGQGNEIIKCYCSPSTYLYSLEKVMHSKMNDYRIQNTEWFYYENDITGEKLFKSAIKLLEKLMCSKNYELCNETRKKLTLNNCQL